MGMLKSSFGLILNNMLLELTLFKHSLMAVFLLREKTSRTFVVMDKGVALIPTTLSLKVINVISFARSATSRQFAIVARLYTSLIAPAILAVFAKVKTCFFVAIFVSFVKNYS